MKPRLLLVVALALPAILGCRTDPAISLLERELYRKDKEINRLRWQIEDMQDTLDSCPERTVPHSTTDDRRPGSRETGGSGLQVDRGEETKGVPPSLKRGGSRGGSIDIDVPGPPPEVEKRGGRSSGDGPSLDDHASNRSSSRVRPVSAVMSAAASAVPFRATGDSRRVASVAIDQSLTGGIPGDDGAGDLGLLVAIQPVDENGRLVAAAGDVNVAVLDPELQGQSARIARWDFSAAETATLFRRTGRTGAMHLALAWPQSRPKHGKLHLFVRYVTADGRKLETNRPIEISQPDVLPGPAKWTLSETLPDDPPGEEIATRDSRPPDEAEPRRMAEPPRMAARPSASTPERPVWSPERR